MNPFLSEEFAPVRAELSEFDLPIRGRVPDWLDGRYLRNGPNPIADLDPETYNWFTGDGMVHGIRIAGGRALWYRNRWIDSPSTERILRRPAPQARRRAFMRGIGANTNVIGFGGRTLALIEAGQPCVELSEELDTLDVWDFSGTVRGGYTAHPIEDPSTGELHAVSYHFGRGGKVRYSAIGRDGRERRHVDIDVGGSPMMHAFSLTASTVVLYDLPLTFAPDVAADTAPKAARPLARASLRATAGRIPMPHLLSNRLPPARPGSYPYHWDRTHLSRVGLMPREGEADDIIWIEVDPCYVYHPMNAHDDGGTVVVDLVVHGKTFDQDITGPTEGSQHLERWTLDPRQRTCRRRRILDESVEFPRIDDRSATTEHSAGWVIGSGGGLRFDRLIRVSASSGDTTVRRFGSAVTVGEFTFVPRAEHSGTDDGVVLGLVTDRRLQTTELAILDASTLEEVGAVVLPTRVPAGFHGNWLPSNA